MKKLSIAIMLLSVLFLQSINMTYAEESTNNITITKGAYDNTCSKFNRCFIPSELLTCVGTKVIWTNNDVGPHQIYSGQVVNGQKLGTYSSTNDGKIESNVIAPGDTFSYMFLKTGTYQYHSAYYLHAQGMIVVKETCDETGQKSQMLSPLQQYKTEFRDSVIKCQTGLELLQKASNGFPACVKSETKIELLKRGWGSETWPFSSIHGGIPSSYSVIPSGNGFKPSFTIEGLNNTYGIGQKIEFTVKYNGTKSGCPDYPVLRVEDSKHQTVWNSGIIITLCDPDTTPIHVEKTWKIGNTPLGSPIINKTGVYTLFAEFEKDIIQQGFWVKQQSQVRIINGASDPEQNRNYLPENITVVIGINNTVTWINEDLVPNSVTSDLEGFDSGSIHPGASWTFTFDKEGFYGYHSEPHPWMKGMVVVELLNKKESSSNSTYSREITVLSISPENVTLPDPKPKAPAKHDGFIQE